MKKIDYSQIRQWCDEFAEQEGLRKIHAFEDKEVIYWRAGLNGYNGRKGQFDILVLKDANKIKLELWFAKPLGVKNIIVAYLLNESVPLKKQINQNLKLFFKIITQLVGDTNVRD